MMLALLGASAADLTDVDTVRLPEPAGVLLPNLESLRLSPGGRYVYALRDENRREGHQLWLVETECLRARGAECPVYAVREPAIFPRNTPYFSADDSLLYLGEVRATAQGRASGDLTIRAYSTEALIAGTSSGPVQVEHFALGQDMKHDVDITTDFALPRWSNGDYHAWAQRALQTVIDGEVRDQASNVFAALSGANMVRLRRTEQSDVTCLQGDMAAERPLWPNGTAFRSRTANLAFKFDDETPLVLAEGSVLRLANCVADDVTARQPRAQFIDGDRPAAYHGYFTDLGARPAHVSARVATAITRAVARAADRHLTGIAVNNRIRAAIISYGPFRHGSADRPEFAFTHDMQLGNTHVVIAAPGEPVANHSVVTVDNGRLFVDRYSRPGNRKHVVYVYGGPGAYGNLETRPWPDMLAILDAGADLDVVHYGGSNYTFALKDHLFRDGVQSIATDARALESYVLSTYTADDFVSLRLNSFGGLFFRWLGPRLLDRFDNVVLDAPAGHLNALEVAREWEVVANQMNFGAGTIADTNAYFDSLTSCPFTRPVTLVVGNADDVVTPLRDYAVCSGSDLLRVVRHEAGHLPSGEINPYAEERVANAMLVRELLRLPDARR